MALPGDVCKAIGGDVKVDHGRLNALVAQELHEGEEVSSVVEEKRGVAVAPAGGNCILECPLVSISKIVTLL